MQVPINVKSPNNISKWQMEFNSAFKGLMFKYFVLVYNTLFIYTGKNILDVCGSVHHSIIHTLLHLVGYFCMN
jgi:hypothetical protein